ncbi:hypothetical protein E2C01_087438 [Portunus trituberculatus]|uniref:Uncharacterized protein n=1 Tax=Portunus trituberculatus TaxID=210409 RepID=A0A5B7JJ87_PORTR|nr:hypothetical protein [Portunus trituberculatus]
MAQAAGHRETSSHCFYEPRLSPCLSLHGCGCLSPAVVLFISALIQWGFGMWSLGIRSVFPIRTVCNGYRDYWSGSYGNVTCKVTLST